MTLAPRCCERARRSAPAAIRARRLAVVLAAIPAEAAAEPAASVSIASEDRFRGEGTSDGRPVATINVGYDDARGPYLGTSVAAGATRRDGVQLLRAVHFAGYAHRVSPTLTIDAGASYHRYTRHATFEYASRFTQVYVGAGTQRVWTRLFYSPNYNGAEGSATYAEVDALLWSRSNWSLTGHVGALASIERGRSAGVEIDWRLGLARRLGRLSVSATWIGRRSLDHGGERTGALVLAAARSF